MLVYNLTRVFATLLETTSFFTYNRGSPQGHGTSGILFNIYSEDAHRRTRAKMIQNNLQIEHSFSKVKKVSLPGEMIYANYTDILNTDQRVKAKVLNTICKIFHERNLQINADKTEHTILKRGKKKAEPWRKMKKLGSLSGDKDDVARRKQLSITAMNNMENSWIKKGHISENHRLKLYRILTKRTLLYNSPTWGLTKQDATNLDSFHRQKLRRITGKCYLSKILNKALYERCHEEPVSSTIIRSRWQFIRHILRLDEASKVMEFYCGTSEWKGFPGTPRETLVTTLSKDVKRVLQVDPPFPLQPRTGYTGKEQLLEPFAVLLKLKNDYDSTFIGLAFG